MSTRSRLLPLLVLIAGAGNSSAHAVEQGDIIFQTSKSGQSVAIQRATGSPYSHMGMILNRNGKPCVFEASATVRYTPLEAWIRRGDGGHYVLKRLRSAPRGLAPDMLEKVRASARRFEGRKYDSTFEWSDDRVYCSELVWKIYDRALGVEIGRLSRLREFKLDDPIVKAKMRERYGTRVPLDEPVISPAAMFSSPRLMTIARR